MPLSVIFMGTPEFAVPTLLAIAGHGHDIAAVYTQPPRPAGRRGLELKKSPVHQQAEQLRLEVRTPVNFKAPEDRDAFLSLQADVAVVVAYGLLLPQPILDGTRLGCFNGHASLLPRWRGAAPIQRAIMAGDRETGVMIMKMDKGLDTGPVAMAEKMSIGDDMTAGELHDRLMVTGADLMVRALGALERGSLTLTPQSETGVTYARKIDKSETRIDWNRPSGTVHNHIRGLSPAPGAWCEMVISGKPERVKILKSAPADAAGTPGEVLDGQLTIACAAGSVQLLGLQRAGGRAIDAEAFLRGATVEKVN